MPTDDRVKYSPDPDPYAPVQSGTQPTKAIGVTPTPVSFMDDINYHRTAAFFDLSLDERKNVRTAEKLSYLTDWAFSRLGTTDPIAALTELKRLKMQLGLTDEGDPLIKKLYQFARLDAQKQQIDRELDLYRKEEPVKEEPKEVKETKTDTKDIKKIVKEEIQTASKEIKTSLKSHINKKVNEKTEPAPEPLSTYITQ